ncbi:Hypothetical protein R9X50_00161600 [Acrodontium crateriforme]|uniref:GRF-type domain-containing protein n=1 Tax=Acrodontium crateriforme TaxID=150365 RepID=A0AAQ3LZC8_9PEZI|nr:Hypothetical protein R9X50_00161600 [Acrodontium crateriforme]
MMQRGRGRGRGGWRRAAPAQSGRGLFADNIWHCDCKPRLPAEHFKVKKEGKNQGRWFYTCQNSQDSGKRCGFFLWEEDAQPRMKSAVLEPQSRVRANERNVSNEQPHTGDEGGYASNKRIQGRRALSDEDNPTDSPSPALPSKPSTILTTGRKRKVHDTDLGNDDFLESLSGQEELELARVADEAAPSTPQKAQKTGVYATPATNTKRKLPWLDPPANTSTLISFLDTPSAQRSGLSSFTDTLGQPETPPTLARTGDSSAIHSLRFKDALKNPADSESSLTSEALAALASVNIPLEALSNLRSVLSRHDLRTQGVIKGRDISRLALKAKDTKIAELQARIASLEAEREMDRGMMRKLRWEMEHSGHDNDDEL